MSNLGIPIRSKGDKCLNWNYLGEIWVYKYSHSLIIYHTLLPHPNSKFIYKTL